MESLQFRFADPGAPLQRGTPPIAAPVLVGVVSSGNLEILLEPTPLAGACEINVRTAAHGFGAIWQAVFADFHRRHAPRDLRISINDMGATPAVVSLRLDQALDQFFDHQE